MENTALVWPNYNQLNKSACMNQPGIVYKQQTASLQSVTNHLTSCSGNFVPTLAETVDIGVYAEKIVKNSITFEAWSNSELAGLIAAYFNDEKREEGYITNVSTLLEYSGRGIASRLLDKCIRYGTDTGFKKIRLEVNSSNQHAVSLYKKHGFFQTGTRKDYILMQKDL